MIGFAIKIHNRQNILNTFLWYLLFWSVTIAFTGCLGQMENVEFKDHVLTVKEGDGTYTFAALSDHIIRVTYRDSIVQGDSIYASVLSTPQPSGIKKRKGGIIFSTDSVEAVITFSPFSIEFNDKKARETVFIEGGFTWHQDSLHLTIQLGEQESIYGLGARAIPMDRRGRRLLYYNKPNYGYGWGVENLNYSIPHYLSSEDYMILIDNPAKAWFDIGKTQANELKYTTTGGNTAFYYISGSDFRELLFHYTDLTGRQPMPPIWALGNLQSRFGYRNRNEAETILQKSIEAEYPVDAIILDLYWFGPELEDGKMGQLDWDTIRWPDPAEMIGNWKDLNVHTILVSEPFFTLRSKHYNELAEKGYLATHADERPFVIEDFYFGKGGLLDIFKPDAATWMWNQYRDLKRYGIDGWWVDLGEPEKHPDTMFHVIGSADIVHGLYGHRWAQMMFNGYDREYRDERFFLLARSAYAGTQRYGIIPWTGDVSRSWHGLKAQPGMMLSAGISGLGLMHSDAGGFTFTDIADEELYIRWLQFAAFTPVFRPHADEILPSEPVLWSEDVQQKVKPYIELRYQLLPYLYTMLWQNSYLGIPMARPLFSQYPGMIDSLPSSYLWGDALLIFPVLEKGQKEMEIDLPNGLWYDWHTGMRLEGGKSYQLNLSLDDIPVFVSAGSIVPMTRYIGHTSGYRTDSLVMRYFAGEELGSGLVYMDDGKTPLAFEKGLYQMFDISTQEKDGSVTLIIESRGDGFDNAPQRINFRMEVIGLSNKPTQILTENTIDFEWDSTNGILIFSVDVEKELKIVVQ